MKYRQIQFALVLELLQKDVIIDFIVKLLKLEDPTIKEVYNLIIVIINKLLKYTIIIPFKETYNIE